jgi:hypothetical protein
MSQSTLDKLSVRLDELEKAGLEESDEYEKISDDYQAIALNMVEGSILGDSDE